MKRINSKEKGKTGELEAAALIRKHGFTACRGQQFAGGSDSPDIVHNIPGVHIEVKRREKLDIYAAMEQATEDRKSHEIPVVLHRRSRKQWLAVLPASDLLRILQKLGGTSPDVAG